MMKKVVQPKQKYSFLPLNDRGFTLIEALVSLMLLGIVLSAAYSIYYLSYTSFNKSGDQYKLQANLRQAGDLITQEIRNAENIEILTSPFITNASYNYFYLEDNKIYHIESGTTSNITESIISNVNLFKIEGKKDNQQYFLEITIEGEKNNQYYLLTTEILLNNIHDYSGLSSGYVIQYITP